jgi:hypothetical protein
LFSFFIFFSSLPPFPRCRLVLLCCFECVQCNDVENTPNTHALVQDQRSLWCALAAILHLGDVQFVGNATEVGLACLLVTVTNDTTTATWRASSSSVPVPVTTPLSPKSVRACRQLKLSGGMLPLTCFLLLPLFPLSSASFSAHNMHACRQGAGRSWVHRRRRRRPPQY